MAKIEIWTDGSCVPNPGVGGWAAILKCNGQRKEISGRLPQSTSSRSELTAVIESLKAVKGVGHEITIYTDSTYTRLAIQGIKKAKVNQDLLEEITTLKNRHQVTVELVPAHNGVHENERCDELANLAIRQ